MDFERAGVSQADWKAATAGCFELRVRRVIDETSDARSIVLEIPPQLEERFRYRPGQFLSFKIPYQGAVLTRSYSLARTRLFGSPVRSSYRVGIRASLERAAPFRVDVGFSEDGVNVSAGFGLGF